MRLHPKAEDELNALLEKLSQSPTPQEKDNVRMALELIKKAHGKDQ